jgi:hypothetical protein
MPCLERDSLPYIEGSGLESKGLMPPSGSIRVGLREGRRNDTSKEKAAIKSCRLSWSTSVGLSMHLLLSFSPFSYVQLQVTFMAKR